MTDKKDIYILCLEKGYECGDTGISYWEMIEYLKEKKIIDPGNFEFHQYFFIWFYDNFYLSANYISRRQKGQTVANQPINSGLWFAITWLSERYGNPKYQDAKPNGQLDIKVPLMYESRQKYLDYLSLKESDRKATHANILSWIAIVLSLILSGLDLFFLFRQDNYNERQELREISRQESKKSFENKCKTNYKEILQPNKMDTLSNKRAIKK